MTIFGRRENATDFTTKNILSHLNEKARATIYSITVYRKYENQF